MARITSTIRGAKSRSSVHHIPILETRDFPGTYSYPKPQQIPRGAAQASLNFLTRSTWIETRGGYHALGPKTEGAGKCLGIFTAHKWDGSEIVFAVFLTGKLKYYDSVSDTWIEVGSDIMAGAAAANDGDGENVYFDEYFSPAGAQLWISSPSSDLIKIMVANPGSYLSQYDSAKNFKGRIRISQNSMWLWHYKTSTIAGGSGTNATQQRSYIDTQAYATKTDSSIAIAIGPTAVTGTLTKNSVAKATVFGTVFTYTDGAYVETFTDDYLGNLTGSLGGTGTIDYSSGAFSITPGVAGRPPASPVVDCTYSYENATIGGIADFTKSGTRIPGEGVAWLQNNGGDILANDPYNGSYYILHQRNAWVITPTADDSGATNIIYRQNISLASERGSVPTAEGVYYIDTTIASRPYIALLTYNPIASQVLPVDLSSLILDLSPYVFDKCVAYQWNDFIVFACRTPASPENNRMIVYNTKLSSSKRRIFDTIDLYANCFCVFNGQLISGDTVSNNVYKLFDGFDDDDGIPNYTWTGNIDDHGIAGLKQTKKLWAEGYIAVNQLVDVYIQLDANAPVKVGTISGSGTYVDSGQAVTIGSLQIGQYPIGGGPDAPAGFHYLYQVTINSAKYKYFTIKFVPTDIGYFSVQMYANYDIRINVDKLPRRYRDNPQPSVSPSIGAVLQLQNNSFLQLQSGGGLSLHT